MPAKSTNNEKTFGIGAVAKLTGLTDHTIRVWERRYEAVVAQRAANGRRVYGAQEVEKLRLLKQLTDRGMSISTVAKLDVDELRSRAEDVIDMASSHVPEQISVALLGELLPNRLLASPERALPLKVVIAESSMSRFEADLQRHDVDVVVLEEAVFDKGTTRRLKAMMKLCGASHGAVVYGFGRSAEIELARRRGVVVLRSPIDIEELSAALIRAFEPPKGGKPSQSTSPPSKEGPHWAFPAEPAPRKFSQQQLARLASISSAIECECPQHLAQLVGELSAFEVYSAQCANRDDEDAALHRYLQHTTAEARALVETALERVAEAEGLAV